MLSDLELHGCRPFWLLWLGMNESSSFCSSTQSLSHSRSRKLEFQLCSSTTGSYQNCRYLNSEVENLAACARWVDTLCRLRDLVSAPRGKRVWKRVQTAGKQLEYRTRA